MGGINSGRRGGKICTEDRRFIDVRQIHREGLLVPGHVFNTTWPSRSGSPASIRVEVDDGRVRFSYQQSWRGGPWRDCSKEILLSWSRCHYGGERPWWVCPACRRRVALLYSGNGWYACRHCFQLAYRSQRETAGDLALRKANRIRNRLGWPAGILNPTGGKPKGMHWSTYLRLVAEHTKHSKNALSAMSRSLDSIIRKLNSL